MILGRRGRAWAQNRSHSGQEAFLMGWIKRMEEREPPAVCQRGYTPVSVSLFYCTIEEGVQFRREEETLDKH